MHYLGWTKVSDKWWAERGDVVNTFINRWKPVLDMARELPCSEVRKVSAKWDVLKYVAVKPVLVTLIGADGKSDHVVAVSNGWVFDGNFPFALPLCQKSLDMCCSSEETQEVFEKCGNKTYMIYERSGSKKTLFPREISK